MIDPSGRFVVPAGVETEVIVDVARVLVAVAFFKVCIECSTAFTFPPFNVADAALAIWLLVMVAGFFNVDWITNLLDSDDSFGVVDLVRCAAFLCKRIDGECDVLHVRLSSSLLVAILTAPVFSKFNKSCPFCKMIWPFSVRAPRIKIMLLGWCDCFCIKLNWELKNGQLLQLLQLFKLIC